MAYDDKHDLAELTDPGYWERSWGLIKLPVVADMNFPNDRAIANFLKNNVCDGENDKTAIEIGCAPGKWMIYMVQSLRYKSYGCEFVHTAAEKTRENLLMNNVNGIVYEGDFLTYTFPEKYDVVVSFGFLEHFTEPIDVVRRMMNILKPGGVLVIGIPLISEGINRWIAYNVDKTLDDKLLTSHNLKIMNMKFFASLPNFIPVKPIIISYVGGFEPYIYNVSKVPFWFRNVFRGISLLLGNSIVRKTQIAASYIMAAYQVTDSS